MTSNNMKAVLLINSSFYPSAGGVETTLRGMAQDLSKHNRRVVVVTGDKTNSSARREAKEEVLFGAKVFRYRVLGSFLYLLTCLWLLLKLKKQYDFELVISRSIPTALCCLLAGLQHVKYVAPAVYRYQNKPVFYASGLLRRYGGYFINCVMEFITITALNKVYVFSDEMVNQIKDVFPRVKVIKIFPGIDIERFSTAGKNKKDHLRTKLNISLEKKVALFMGRLEQVKCPLDVLDVAYLMPDDYLIIVVGEGTLKTEMIEAVQSRGLSDKIIFFPFTTSPENFYHLSDVFLMTSVYEPFGQVILEALASGVRVIGYKGLGVRTATQEIFEHLGIDETVNLCSFDKRGKGLADLLKEDISERSKFEFRRSWSDFADEIACR